MKDLDRRSVLRLGAGVVVLSSLAGCDGSAVPATITVSDWVARRRPPYFIAHRGAGTTVPEHSLPGYRAALDWGAEALELSVVASSDGVLYCHHDLELDRTTTLTGSAARTTSAVLDTGRISIPRLGPRWSGTNMPAIPRLEAVLDEIGRRAVLCVEAKDAAAYEPLMALLAERDLSGQVMVKTPHDSSRVQKAKAAGLPVFAYIGTIEQATASVVTAAAAGLGPTDALVLPARQGGGAFLDEEVVRQAVAAGAPVWVYAVNRRSEVARFSALGVSGFVTPALGYLTGRTPVATSDTFATGAIAPGLTTRDPYSDWYALGWDTPDAIGLTGGGPRWVCLGDLSPVGRPEALRLALDLSVTGAGAAADTFELAFSCRDDTYCPDGGTGYAASLRCDGLLQLSVRTAAGTRPLAAPVQTPALAPGEWTRLSVEVNGSGVSCTRDGASVTADDLTWRGGYVHVGRATGSTGFSVRHVAVTR